MRNGSDEYMVEYTQGAVEDLKNLPAVLIGEYKNKMEALKKKAIRGKELTCKNGKDLTGCYKVYFDEARYRIVYKIKNVSLIDNNEKIKVEILAVLGIGKRDNEEIYNEVARRLGQVISEKDA